MVGIGMVQYLHEASVSVWLLLLVPVSRWVCSCYCASLTRLVTLSSMPLSSNPVEKSARQSFLRVFQTHIAYLLSLPSSPCRTHISRILLVLCHSLLGS